MVCVRSGIVTLALLLVSCSSTEWVHPTKPKEQFAQDYNRCETQAYQDPKMQAGMKLLLQENIEKCLRKNGWLLVEKP